MSKVQRAAVVAITLGALVLVISGTVLDGHRGSVPDWIEVLGITVALVAAFLLLRRELQGRRTRGR